MDEILDEVWVLAWRYSDGSSSGVLRAYASEERANLDMDLLRDENGMKNYEIKCVPVYR